MHSSTANCTYPLPGPTTPIDAPRPGIPDDIKFATKYQLAQRMIERARAAGTPFTWVTADEVYGQAEPLRDYLEREKISYVLAVRRTEKVTLHPDTSTAEAVIGAPETQWQRMSAGEGTKGPRVVRLVNHPNSQQHKQTKAIDTSSRGEASTIPPTSRTTSATRINQ